MIHGQNDKELIVIKPASVGTDATSSGQIDTLGFDHAVVDFLFDTAAAVSNNPAVMKLQEADVTNDSSFADISGCVGDTDFTIPNADTANPWIHKFSVNTKVRKRYLRAVLTSGGAATISCVTARLNRGSTVPDSTTEMGVLSFVVV